MASNSAAIADPFKIDFNNFSDDDMFSLRTQIEKEFKRRNTKFNIGDIGETLAVHYFNSSPGLDNLQRTPTGTRNVDALSRRVERAVKSSFEERCSRLNIELSLHARTRPYG